MRPYRIPKPALAVLFDVDGTLYTDEAYGRFQIDILIEELARVRGEAFEATAAAVEEARSRLAKEQGLATTSLGNAMAALGVSLATSVAWRQRLIDPARFLRPDPRLAAALVALRRSGAAIAAVTNNPRSVGEATLAALGVREAFDAVVGLDDTMLSKPSPEPYLLAARLLGTAPTACLSVGDRYDVDLAVPLELGMGAVLVDGVEDVYKLPKLLAGA